MTSSESAVVRSVTSIKARRRVEAMPEYHPPLGNRDGLRLDFNENTLACSPQVLEAIRNISAAELTRYPERGVVEASIATHLNLLPDQVILTNGVDEGIHVLCEAFLDKGDELLFPVPTYTMYEIYGSATDASIVPVLAEDNFRFPFQRVIEAITPATKLIALSNPNSPTGSIVSREQIVEIAKAAPRAILLVDEAYFHFYGQTVMELVGTIPNLVVARTFSKAYGLAGLRIGLLAGPVDLLRWVRRVLSPYSVNSIALTALTAALKDCDYLNSYVSQVKLARTEFLSGLDAIGLSYWPTEANFVLVNIGADHAQFAAAMKHEGILVRDRSADPGCDGCVRITIGTSKQMRQTLSAIKMFLVRRLNTASLDLVGN